MKKECIKGGVIMEDNLTMYDLMADVEKSMAKIHKNEIKQAEVIEVTENEITVDIGYRADAIIPWKEYSSEPVVDKSEVKVGDTFKVAIMRIDDGEGNVLVSKRRAESERAMGEIETLYKDQAIVDVKIKEATKGGLITFVKGVRAFIPGSQITDTYVEDLNSYVGQTLPVQIIQFEPKNRRLVLSGKTLARQQKSQKRAERLSQLVVGEVYTGTITKLMPYGAFVSLDGVEGLVHNTDLSWVRIKHPSDVVKEGEAVKVKVLSVDNEKGRVALSVKDMLEDPWQAAMGNLEEGQTVSGSVVKFMSFGAFVKISEGVEGLVHISQICDKRITKPEEALEIGQEVNVKITKIDRQEKKIALSILAAQTV
ncbi:MAG: 30S ribosomal protein S1 [Epulopiscium sp. Nele67-Bin005]|nr:MAG: 30S ribosomal protein S1 [Epulopiscium sp. Nele67-Bin005]